MAKTSGSSNSPDPEEAKLRDREAVLERLKQQIFHLERIGRYDDSRKARELLAAATEAVGITRLRLARIAYNRSEAERVRQRAETVQDQKARQQLLRIADRYEEMAESLRLISDSDYE